MVWNSSDWVQITLEMACGEKCNLHNQENAINAIRKQKSLLPNGSVLDEKFGCRVTGQLFGEVSSCVSSVSCTITVYECHSMPNAKHSDLPKVEQWRTWCCCRRLSARDVGTNYSIGESPSLPFHPLKYFLS